MEFDRDQLTDITVSEKKAMSPTLKKSLFVAVAAIVIIICTVTPIMILKNKKVDTLNDIMVSADHADYLYRLLDDVTKVLHEHKLDYWIISGTLIGQLRNIPPGPMQWDDDFDISMFHSDAPKLLKAFENHPNLTVWEVPGLGYKIDYKGGHGWFDVITVKKRDNGSWSNDWFPKLYIEDKAEVFPLYECKIWDITTKCARKSSLVMSREYGTEALNTAKLWNHDKQFSEVFDLNENKNYRLRLPLMSLSIAQKLQFGSSTPIMTYERLLQLESDREKQQI